MKQDVHSTQIDRAHRDWTPTQIGFIANLVRLYRGEDIEITLGGGRSQRQADGGLRQKA